MAEVDLGKVVRDYDILKGLHPEAVFSRMSSGCFWAGQKMPGYGYPCCHPDCWQGTVEDPYNCDYPIMCDDSVCPLLKGLNYRDAKDRPFTPKGANHYHQGHPLLHSDPREEGK